MEETLQKEAPELEYNDSDDNQGDIHRRLRDRDLLRKRKAEMEEKETTQWVYGEESRRKRARGEKSSAGKRGRPRKTEPAPEIPAPQEELAQASELPSVVVMVQEPEDVSPAQTLPSLTALASLDPDTVEPQPAYVPAAPAPIPLLASVPTPVLTLAQAPAPASDLPSAPAPAPIPLLASVPTSALPPAPAPAPAPDPDSAPPQVESVYTAFQGREALDQSLIEDLGLDEEEDIPPSQDRANDEDVNKEPSPSVPEQSKTFSSSTLSTPPPPQQYLPGNYF